MAPLHGGFSAGKSGLCCDLLARRCGPSGFAPIRSHVALLCWLFLPRPTKERPYDLWGPWAFREVFYSFSGPGGYLSPTDAAEGACAGREQSGAGRRARAKVWGAAEGARGERAVTSGEASARDGVGSSRGSATKRAVEGARKHRGSSIGSARASRGELVRAIRPSPAKTSTRPRSVRAAR
jgi:hypothetical protein